MTFSKTTVSGVASILGGVTIIGISMVHGPTVAGDSTAQSLSLATGLGLITSGLGAIASRDHSTSDEEAGATPGQKAMVQAVHNAAAAAPVTKTDPTTGVITITPAAPPQTPLPSVLTKV